MFLWAGRVRAAPIDCEGGIDEEHLFLTTRGGGACELFPLVIYTVVLSSRRELYRVCGNFYPTTKTFMSLSLLNGHHI